MEELVAQCAERDLHFDLIVLASPSGGTQAGLEDFIVDGSCLGGGYGVVGELEREAIRTLARTEGVLLGPVYTSRAFGGLLDMIRGSAFQPSEQVLFWHTGGTARLFGYAKRIS